MTIQTITFDDAEWQVVPREPTDSMFAAADAENDRAFVDGRPHGAPFADMYYAALDAAPEPQVCFCDEKGIGDPEKSCGDCPRDYGIPTVRANPEPPAQPRRPYGTDTMSEYGVIPECDGSEPPAQQQDEQLPPYSAWLHVLDEAMVVRHLGVADPDDDYITAKRKLHAMFDWEIDVATDPAVGGDRVRKQQPMTKTELVVALKPVLDAIFANETVPPAAWEASVRNVEQFHGIGKGESK